MAIEWKKALLKDDSHTLLSDVGTKTHAQIDTHITTYASHDHSASDPTQVSHTNLTSVSSDQHHDQIHASEHQVGGADLVNHDSLTGFVAAEHVSLPNTIANVLSDHTKAAHDALNIDADTLDSHDTSYFQTAISAGTTAQYWRGDKTWQTFLGATSATAYRGDRGTTAYNHSQDNSQAHSDYMLNTGDTATGNYAFDTDTLFIDATNHRVGIGTTDTEIFAGLTVGGSTCENIVVRAGAVKTTVEASGAEPNIYGWIGTATNHALHIGTSGVYRMTISSAGAVTIFSTLDAATINTGAGDMEVNTIAAYLGNQNLRTTDSPTFVRATLSQATGTAPFTIASTTKVTNLNADLLEGYHAASTATANTIALRNSSGDINARLFRSEYDTTNATCNIIYTAIDTASNNYLRPSTKAQLIASLALMKTTGGTFTGYVYARDHGTAATDMIVNVCYGTGNPPTANTTTIGTLFVKYS